MTTTLSPKDVYTLLQDIEHRSRQGTASDSNQHGLWTAIGFRIGNEHFAIPLQQSREIFPVPQHITPVPRSQAWVFGIANIRGELLPIIDLKHFLLGKTTKANKHSRVVVLNQADLYSGLLIDEVYGLKHFHQQPEPNSALRDSPVSSYITGAISQQDITWNVFSFDKLSTDIRFLNAAA